MLPCLVNTASVLAAMKAGTLDEDILEAAWKDARETFRRAAGALCESLRCEQTVERRPVWMLTALDWVHVPYPYAPGLVTGREAAALLCGGEQGAKGQIKATRAARRRIARMGVTAGSYAETAELLKEFLGMTPSRELVRQVVNEAARRTREALFAGELARIPGPKWMPPEGARRVPPTMVVAPDGVCFPCVKADLAGRAGRDGGPAKGRNANVVCIGWYEHVDAKGRPVFPPGSIQYFTVGEGGEAFGRRLWELAVMMGVEDAPRVEYVSDGEKELECAYQEHFAALPNVSRALDAMHACGYVDTLVKALEPDAAKAPDASKRLRRRLVNAGWKGFVESLGRRYGKDAPLRLEGDARKAWSYLESRAAQMDYRNLRRRHMVIGSGMAEVGCKLTVGGRLKGPGMHWRFENGIGVALLRGILRSRREIAA